MIDIRHASTYDALVVSLLVGLPGGRPRQEDGQREGREHDARGEEEAELLERRRRVEVVREAPREDRRQRTQGVEDQHEEGPPVADVVEIELFLVLHGK